MANHPLWLLRGMKGLPFAIDEALFSSAKRRFEKIVHVILSLPIEGMSSLTFRKKEQVLHTAFKVRLHDLGAGIGLVPDDRCLHVQSRFLQGGSQMRHIPIRGEDVATPLSTQQPCPFSRPHLEGSEKLLFLVCIPCSKVLR